MSLFYYDLLLGFRVEGLGFRVGNILPCYYSTCYFFFGGVLKQIAVCGSGTL